MVPPETHTIIPILLAYQLFDDVGVLLALRKVFVSSLALAALFFEFAFQILLLRMKTTATTLALSGDLIVTARLQILDNQSLTVSR